MTTPRVFTIPPGTPFLPTLADALLSGELTGAPVRAGELADATIYLPTRRAGRALATILAERSGGALLLPRIVPLGDADEAMVDLSGAEVPTADLAPAIAPLERRLILARLITAWAESVDRAMARLEPGVPFAVPGSPADAVSLAGELEGLMDELATADLEWAALAEVVEVEYSHYFSLTLDFVRIAHQAWPTILADRGASDPVRRRNAALDAQAVRLAADPPAGPVIAAGSTGSVPATARLLAAVSRLPRGAVVLPGLDGDLDEAGWRAIGGSRPMRRISASAPKDDGSHGHPQFNLKRLLDAAFGIDRGAVRVLGSDSAPARARRRLVSEVLRPAETTDSWAATPPLVREELAQAGAEGLAVVEAHDEREEALAAAIAIRETLAEPGRTVALVTPDRDLARRVAAELGRWNVSVADSAPVRLSDTPAGRLARLAAEAAALDFHPVPVLALLNHPDTRLGLDGDTLREGVAALEIGVLRGPAPRPGLDGLAAALDVRRRERGRRDPIPRARLSEADWDKASLVLDRLGAAFREFPPVGPDLPEGRSFDLVRLAGRHARTVAAVAEAPPDDEPASPTGWDALLALFDELALARAEDGSGRAMAGRLGEYPAFFAALARDRTLPPQTAGAHARVRILGLLEARLLHVDRVILGGLDEGLWPPRAETDAFLNRPMRTSLGLSSPERRIGQTAHDFAQALGAPEVVITRAGKRANAPTVPSRFLERLRAFVGPSVWGAILGRGQRYRALAAALDQPRNAPVPSRRPAPRPGPERFPRRLSVTEVETLVRDPYAIFARHILRLQPLDPVAVSPNAAERGTIFHEVLSGFARAVSGPLPANAEALLLQLGMDAFRPVADAYPELYALWWPSFARLVAPLLEWERERRASGGSAIHVERPGALHIPLPVGEPFELVGRADRIEFDERGGGTIIDFKTGKPPTNAVVSVGFSPQLTLEAAMLGEGGFREVPRATEVPSLLYVRIGGRDPLVLQPVEPPKGDARSLPAIVDAHLDGLRRLVHRYAVEGAPYLSRPYPQYARAFAPYDHLARVAEWAFAGDEGTDA